MAAERQRAVVLLSGGLDSATAAAMAADQGFALYALTVAYGQRHAVELEAAARVAKSLGVAKHVVETLDLRLFGGSALTADIEVPKSTEPSAGAIPVTYVPARNTIFLALAVAYAEVVGSRDIFIGVNAVDYSGYPDCRPNFIRAFEDVARLGTRAGVEGRAARIHAPLVALSKAEIVRAGVKLGVDFSVTHSCYDPQEGLACGLCESCRLRRKGFEDAGVPDPTRYVKG